MTVTNARYQRQAGRIVLSSGDFIDRDDAAVFFAPLDTVKELSLAALRRCLAAASVKYDSDRPGDHVVEELHLTDSPPDQFDHDYSPRAAHSFGLTARGELRLYVVVPIAADADEQLLRGTLSVFLRDNRLQVLDIEPEGVPGATLLTLTLRCEVRGRNIGDAYALADQLGNLVQTLVDGGGRPESWWDLLRGGHATTLVGQPESATLEAKSRAYDPSVEADQIELAQDVARFANAEHGGLLCIGFRTRRRGLDDIIEKVTPIIGTEPARLASRYKSILDRKIYPPVVGVQIAAVGLSGTGSLILLRVPAQPEELKPFLVHGAIAAGKVEGAFISIVRRRGEDSIPATPAEIHAWISAGRALMRGGHLPDPRQPKPRTNPPAGPVTVTPTTRISA